MKSERKQLGERRHRRRRDRRVPAERTRGTHPQPLVNALSVKAMVTVGNAAYSLIGKIIAQANGAWAFVGLWQAPTLSNYNLRVGLDSGLFEAQDHRDRPIMVNIVVVINVILSLVLVVAAVGATIGFDADAGVGSEHDGGDEDEDADGDGDAVAETDAGGGGGDGWRSRRRHERREREREMNEI